MGRRLQKKDAIKIGGMFFYKEKKPTKRAPVAISAMRETGKWGNGIWKAKLNWKLAGKGKERKGRDITFFIAAGLFLFMARMDGIQGSN